MGPSVKARTLRCPFSFKSFPTYMFTQSVYVEAHGGVCLIGQGGKVEAVKQVCSSAAKGENSPGGDPNAGRKPLKSCARLQHESANDVLHPH